MTRALERQNGTVASLRRRAVGPPAARSMLLTLLGEAAQPRPEGVWQETLVAALVALEYSEPAARQAVARSIRDGWLRSERVGRRTRMHLTPEIMQVLREGGPRIYGFGPPIGWDGRWLVVVVRVAEEQRQLRHQVRTELTRAGLGSLGGGVWITPHVDRERAVAETLARVGDDVVANSFHADHGEIGRDGEIVSAWQLDTLHEQYREFLARFAPLRPRSAETTFRAQLQIVHAWRKFAFIDPSLPDELLPRGWPRRRAYRLFRERTGRWHGPAQAYFDELGG